MIVLLVLGIVMLLYALIKGVTRHEVRWVAIVLGAVLVVSMFMGLQRAKDSHFLLTKVPVDKTQKIKPAITVNGLPLITTQKGNDGELRYTYSVGNKHYQTMTQNAKTTVKIGAKTATLKTEVTTYQALSAWRRLMLLGQSTFEKGAATYTLSLPDDWYIVPSSKVATLQKMVDTSKQNLSDEVAKQVKQKFMEKSKDDNNFLNDKDAQNKLQTQIVTDETNKANDALKKAMLEKIQDWQK